MKTKHLLIVLSYYLFLCNVQAQTPKNFQFNYDCKKFVLEENVLVEQLDNTSYFSNLTKSLYDLNECGLDSIDVELLTKPQVLGTILINFSNNLTSNVTKLKLLDLIKGYEKFAAEDSYYNARNFVLLNRKYLNYEVNRNTWNEYRRNLQELNTSKDFIKKIDDEIKSVNNQKITYQELFEKIEIEKDRNKINYESISWNKYKVSSVEELLELAKVKDQPLLIYFRSRTTANCKKIEKEVLTNPEVLEAISYNYTFLELTVDETKELPKENHFRKNGMLIDTYGKQLLNIQIDLFKSNHQPYFVILDNMGNNLSSIGYVNLKKFITFLKMGNKG